MNYIKIYEEFSKTPVKDFFEDKIDMKTILFIEKVLTKYEDEGCVFDADVMIIEDYRHIYDMQSGTFYECDDIGDMVYLYNTFGLTYVIECYKHVCKEGIYDKLKQDFSGKFSIMSVANNSHCDVLFMRL